MVQLICKYTTIEGFLTDQTEIINNVQLTRIIHELKIMSKTQVIDKLLIVNY